MHQIRSGIIQNVSELVGGERVTLTVKRRDVILITYREPFHGNFVPVIRFPLRAGRCYHGVPTPDPQPLREGPHVDLRTTHCIGIEMKRYVERFHARLVLTKRLPRRYAAPIASALR